ncbi:MAG: fused MFS/spermidine synthase [Gammaproteobacteria bacterium]|nr:fused MFS/spermidine synthase [Gammaproteobacteria bacterium]
MRLLVLTLFFFSGACGLVYQIVWVRMLTHVFGTTAAAVGVVLAAFMSGLALGSWLLGKVADRNPNPLRFYAILEIGIGLAALAAHFLLGRITPVYLALYEISGQSEATLAAARFILAFGLVMLPTFLMGATLPVLARFVVRRLAAAGADLSTLYAINTAGAVAGAMASGFYLIGSLGIHVTVYVAVAGNLVLGLIAWAASGRMSPAPVAAAPRPKTRRTPEAPSEQALPRATFALLLLALGISGLTSFAYEIYWTRALVFVLGNSTYALTTMLTAFISGIALGGYLARLAVDRVADRVALFGWIQVLIAVSSAVALPLLFAFIDPQAIRLFLGEAAGAPGQLTFARFGIALLVMLVPATLIGATFPLVGRAGIVDLQHTGRRIGLIYASNTLGNVAGALLPGFVLLNWLGIQRGILLMAALNAVIGFTFLARRLSGARYLRWAAPTAAVGALLVLARVPLDFQFPSEGERPTHRTLFYRDGPSATTKVTLDPDTGDKVMAIDGIVIGGNTFTEYKQLLLAHLPKFLRDDVSTELSIGLGSGMLAGESIRHERVQAITCVEIEPSVVAGAAFFADENHRVLSNPRVRIVIDDIANYLRTTSDRYHVISADEKTSLDYASNGFSYSREYYFLLRQRLAPGGILIQWMPANLPPSQYAMVLKTFADSFPHVLVGFFMPALRESGYNTILVGSDERISLDSTRIDRVMRAAPRVLAGLARYGLTTPEAVLAQFVAGGEVVRQAVRDAPENTLVHPRYEFFSPWDYAVPIRQRIAANIEFMAALKRAAAPGFLAAIKLRDPDEAERLKRALAAEQAFLNGYRISLGPVSATDIFRQYDAALALAPWNESLRARIYLHYSDIADSQTDTRIRTYLMERARAARDGNPSNPATPVR